MLQNVLFVYHNLKMHLTNVFVVWCLMSKSELSSAVTSHHQQSNIGTLVKEPTRVLHLTTVIVSFWIHHLQLHHFPYFRALVSLYSCRRRPLSVGMVLVNRWFHSLSPLFIVSAYFFCLSSLFSFRTVVLTKMQWQLMS